MNKNGIAHIYEKNEQEPLLDMKMKNIELISPLQSITQLREEEIAQHLMVCHEMYEKKGNKYKEKIDKLEEKNDLVKKKNQEYQQTIKEQKKMISELEKELNYKSVQFVSKIRRALAKTGIVKKLKSFWKRRR